MDWGRALLVGRSTVAADTNAKTPIDIFRVPRFELHQTRAANMRHGRSSRYRSAQRRSLCRRIAACRLRRRALLVGRIMVL